MAQDRRLQKKVIEPFGDPGMNVKVISKHLLGKKKCLSGMHKYMHKSLWVCGERDESKNMIDLAEKIERINKGCKRDENF